MHTTCTLFINEFQTALLTDIKRFLEQMVARDAEWMHNNPEHSDCDRMNADSHLRALLLGHSLTLQVSGGEVVLGQWQRILMAELDGPRARDQLRIQLMGVGAGQSGNRQCSPVFASAGLSDIADKLDAGVRLTLDDGVRLFETPDLLAVGWLANREREKRHGARTFYNYNIRLEATNVCVASCLFCSFARLKPGDADAHTRCRSTRRGTSSASAPTSRSPKSTSSTACIRICRSTTTRRCCAASNASARASI